MNFFHLEKAKRATQGRNDLRRSASIHAHQRAIEDYYERHTPDASTSAARATISVHQRAK